MPFLETYIYAEFLLGTNTYIVGQRNPYILIDTGEGHPDYTLVLEEALRETAKSSNPSLNESDVSDIILSHFHHDHVGGLPSVLSLLQKLWDERNSPLPFKPPRIHKFPLQSDKLSSVLDSLPPNSHTPDQSGRPIHDLCDSQIFRIAPDTPDHPGTSLHVLHTPGHTSDSICLYLSEDQTLFTADTVLGQGTAVFEDLAAYMASLRMMLDIKWPKNLTDSSQGQAIQYAQLYPGHGPVICNGPDVISMYIRHRQEREDQILKILANPPSNGNLWTTWSIVSVIYAAYPQSLWLPAARSVELHLCKLEGEGRVKRLGGGGKDVEWNLLTDQDIISE